MEIRLKAIRNKTYSNYNYDSEYVCRWSDFKCSDRFQARFGSADIKHIRKETADFIGFEVLDTKDIKETYYDFYIVCKGLKGEIVDGNKIMGVNKIHAQFLFKVLRFYITEETADWLYLWRELYEKEDISILKSFIISLYYLISIDTQQTFFKKIYGAKFIVNTNISYRLGDGISYPTFLLSSQHIDDFINLMLNEEVNIRLGQVYMFRMLSPYKDFKRYYEICHNSLNGSKVKEIYMSGWGSTFASDNNNLIDAVSKVANSNFIKLVREKKFKEAAEVLPEQNYFDKQKIPSKLF